MEIAAPAAKSDLDMAPFVRFLAERLDTLRPLLKHRVEKRVGMRAEAQRRIDVLDAELERIRDQMALMREQALLSADPAAIGRSVDGLAAFLNESGRWLKDQEEIFGEIGDLGSTPYVSGLADSPKQRNSKRVGESQ